jgi:exodeoxyribonuclease V gamma subunit
MGGTASRRVGLNVHRGERTDALLAGLAQLLAETPPDPFAPDLVAVPTPGIERFISQGLGSQLGATRGRADGVCANVVFPSPASLVNHVVAQATGIDPASDPWLAHRAVWPLLAVMDRDAVEPWCRPLARHLGTTTVAAGAAEPGAPGTPDPAERADRRFAVAARLAGLFASYAGQRPTMLQHWADGRATDGAGGAIPEDLAWQPELWRRLRAEIGAPSPAERLARACAAVVADPSVVDLPDRISVFGPTRLPADHLQVLAALGTGREVHLWLADASPTQWEALGAPTTGTGSPRRRLDASGLAVRHPLIRSLGRDARELRLRLAALGDAVAPHRDEHLPAALPEGTLLGQLQRQLRDDLDPWAVRAEAGPLLLAADDRSLQVHACHGHARQAEVVREVVLGLLQSDPTLEPRDILIMCPDLATFAPLLSAAFSEPTDADRPGARPGAPIGPLRLRIADRTPEQSNDVLAALAVLLDMVSGRMELSAVLDFAARPPVRTRFGLDDDTLARLAELATRAGIRWGLDDSTRGQYQVRVPTGTWAWGLDRLLLGAAMSEEGLPVLGGVLPVDDVQGGDVTPVGALAELVTRLGAIRDAMAGRHPLAHWVRVLSAAMTDLMDARGADAWQLPNALAAVTALTDHAADHAATVDLRLADVRWLLAGVLAGRPTRSNFRSGGLTVCGLMPMRSVPHRMVCLVGMDDGAFPRSVVPDGDDVLARDPLVGERDPRSEDRQLLLDAIMAATEHLVITYTGADDRTNEPRPPCVPLGELLDTVDAMAVTAAGAPAREQVRTAHPLQPFDARNFTAGVLGSTGPFSHDRQALAAARTAAGARQPAPPFLVGDLPALPLVELSLRDLGAFLASPPAALLRTRVGLSLRGEDDPPPERIPLELDGLERWAIGARALELVLHGAATEGVRDAELHRGALPPGALGTSTMAEIGADVTDLADRVAALRAGLPGRHVSIRIDLPGGVRLTGTVPGVHGTRIVRGTFSKSKATHQLGLWPELLAAAVAEPGSGWTARLETRNGGVALVAPDPERCADVLAELVSLHAAGMRAPLPVLPESGLLYAQRRAAGQPVSQAVRAAASGAWARRFSPDRDLAEVVMLWGPQVALEDLLAERPRPDERWYPDEPSRFGALARRLWEPILAARGPLR